MQKRSANNGAMGAAKKARACTKPADTKGAPEKETGGHTEEIETLNVFTLDMDTLECAICTLPFDSQIYTCKNGHAACGNCCISLNRRCSFCTETIGDFRCRAMEKILAGMTRPCKYSKYGCTKVVTFIEMRKHEETCSYGPYNCPFNGCTYNGVQLYDHVLGVHVQDGQATNVEATYTLLGTRVTLHRGTPFHALLHRDGKTLFMLLNGGGVPTGRSLSIVRVCPRPGPDEEEEDKVKYEIVVRGDEPWSLSLKAPGMRYVRRLEGYQPERFLFVPDAFWGSSGRITVTVYV